MTVTADAPETATDRLVAKLGDPHARYSSGQVAYLMGLAAQWSRDVADGEPSKLSHRAGFEAGYRARVAEENSAYPPETDPIYVGLGSFCDRIDYRRACDAEARIPRPDDFQGYGDQYVAELRERWAFPDGDGAHQD